jgi:glycosyltransferase involved in cell wall biosynthesis
MTSPRVLHVFKYFRPQFTGEGVFVERLAPVFAQLRPDVRHDVLVTGTPRPAADEPAPPGLGKVHYLARSASGASQPQIVAWLGRHARRYDVVHHHTHVDRTFLGALLLKLQGCRLVLSATLDDSVAGLMATYRPAFRPLVRRLFGLIDIFVAISPKLFDETSRLVALHKCRRVSMGIPMPGEAERPRRWVRESLGAPRNATILVAVGGICARKDQLFLVQQLPGLVLRRPDLLLMLVGPVVEAEHLRQIEAFVAEHGLERHVRIVGQAPPWDFYRAADIFVFASHEEGFGTVMIEAMAYGLPVVARHLPGVNDSFIRHGRTGLLFADADEFNAHLDGLLRNPAAGRRLGACARRSVRGGFDISGAAAKYLALYGYPARSP